MMARSEDEKQALGPSVVMGLIGAIFVLLLLGGGIWGVGKIVERIRETREETQEETQEDTQEEVAEEGTEETEETEEAATEEKTEETTQTEEQTEEGEVQGEETEGDVNGDAVMDENTGEESTAEEDSGSQTGIVGAVWTANDYKQGDIEGDEYEVVWGDTLWEIAEARYGDGFEWVKIKDANSGDIGYLPNGSQALIFPGQVLSLP